MKVQRTGLDALFKNDLQNLKFAAKVRPTPLCLRLANLAFVELGALETSQQGGMGDHSLFLITYPEHGPVGGCRAKGS